MLLGCINSGVYAATVELTAIVNYHGGNSMAGTPALIELTKCSSSTVDTCIPAKPEKTYGVSKYSLIDAVSSACQVPDSNGYSLCKMKIIVNKKNDVTKLISAEKIGDVPEDSVVW